MKYTVQFVLGVKNHENIFAFIINERVHIIDMDLNDAHSIRDVVISVVVDYLLPVAQSFVAGSWKYPRRHLILMLMQFAYFRVIKKIRP